MIYKETKLFLALGALDTAQTRLLDRDWQKYVREFRRALKARKIKVG